MSRGLSLNKALAPQGGGGLGCYCCFLFLYWAQVASEVRTSKPSAGTRCRRRHHASSLLYMYAWPPTYIAFWHIIINSKTLPDPSFCLRPSCQYKQQPQLHLTMFTELPFSDHATLCPRRSPSPTKKNNPRPQHYRGTDSETFQMWGAYHGSRVLRQREFSIRLFNW